MESPDGCQVTGAGFPEGRTVFVAGGTGLAGTSVIRHLLASCGDVKIRASFRETKPFLSDPRLFWMGGDLRLPDICREMAKGCDCAVLTAAHSFGAAGFAARPWDQINDNAVINLNILRALHEGKVRRAVFVGSATVYPETGEPMREDALDWNSEPAAAHAGIGWTMRYLEKICGFWHRRTGMEILIARCANIYGPFARFDPATANVIPALIRKAVARMDPFEVWGGPDVVRDVLFAEDFARAVVVMLAATGMVHDVFNLGFGRGTRIDALVKAALDASGHVPSKIVYDRSKPVTTKARLLDCSKAERLLGWKAEVSPEEGIRRTVAWWSRHKGWWSR